MTAGDDCQMHAGGGPGGILEEVVLKVTGMVIGDFIFNDLKRLSILKKVKSSFHLKYRFQILHKFIQKNIMTDIIHTFLCVSYFDSRQHSYH